MLGEEIAKKLADDALYIVGIAQGSSKGLQALGNRMTAEATKNETGEPYGRPTLKLEDNQFLKSHDCFSITEPVHIIDLSVIEQGQCYEPAEEDVNSACP